MSTKIFVYGTLLREQGNWSWALRDQVFVCEAETEPEYSMISLGGFPGVLEDGDYSIKGEVFDVSDERMIDINRLEGVNHTDPEEGMYRAEPITLIDGTEALIYIYNSSGTHKHTEIESGSWLDYCENQNKRYG
jgi:gamma-glutamylcyclotransferase (GGCT)/AIG2-like uncharacterized protein YtfP